jgi:hypothetical protein
MLRSSIALSWLALTLAAGPVVAAPPDLLDRVRDRYADSDGVNIHYVAVGRGPLLVMIRHGLAATPTRAAR